MKSIKWTRATWINLLLAVAAGLVATAWVVTVVTVSLRLADNTPEVAVVAELPSDTSTGDQPPDAPEGATPPPPTTTATTSPKTTTTTAPVVPVASSCDHLLDYYQTHGMDQVGPYGLGSDLGDGWLESDLLFSGFRGSGAGEIVSFSAAGSADGMMAEPLMSGYSGTNVQVEGVDEGDLVKTDGRYLYTIVGGRLRIVSTGSSPELVATVTFGYQPTQLLLHGVSVVIVGNSPSVVHITHVDVSDPVNPVTVADLEVDGVFLTTRLTSDGLLRLVVTSGPVGFEWTLPHGSGLRAENKAAAANRLMIAESTLDNWLPTYHYEHHQHGESGWGRLVECDTVHTPEDFGGLTTLSMIMFDLNSGGIGEWTGAAVTGDGAVVYATDTSLYAATESHADWAFDSPRTTIHKFSVTDGAPQYVASGQVGGYLLNQFSLDEHGGYLRVATTTTPPGRWTDQSESGITLLYPNGHELEEAGEVWGLGKGERIYAVRFMGDTGYVVTFRQIDPLYVVDLKDPTEPVVLGELKIPGFSNYLHPVGPDRLLGVGQEENGLQLSLFDVSNPTRPQRIAKLAPFGKWQSSGSLAQHDHRAFTYHQDQAYLPFWAWRPDKRPRDWWDGEGQDTIWPEKWRHDGGVLVVSVTDSRVTQAALLRPNPDNWRDHVQEPRRVTVINNHVYSVTETGVAVHAVDGWEWVDYIKWRGA